MLTNRLQSDILNSLIGKADFLCQTRPLVCEERQPSILSTAERGLFIGGDMSKAIGLTYQKLVEYQLLKREFVVNETLGDYSPYDLIAEKDGRMFRIQVRSTHRKLSKENRGYKLQCCSWTRKNILTKRECDFIIAIAGEKDICYIIPIEKIKQKTIILHPDKEDYPRFPMNRPQFEKMKWENYEERWDLLK